MTQYAPFCNKSVEYLRKCYNNWLNVAEGGKRAGKNVLNILAWCDILETHPDKLHLAAGVSNATAKLNIVDSNGFGLLSYFKGRCRQGKYQEKDALIIQTQTCEKIILIAGGGREGDEKLIKGWTLGTAYITEVNECCQTFVKEVFDRTLSSSNRKIFFDLNPKSPNHWFYEEILNFHTENNYKFDNYGLNYEHFTLHDNFSFNDDKIRDIIRTYAKGTVWYKRDILGQRTNAEGIIYDMFTDDNTYEDGQSAIDFERWMNVYYGIDYGTANPFVVLKMIEQDGFYYIDDEYYYDSKKHNRQKEDTEYAEDTVNFIDNHKYIQIVVDPSATSFKVSGRKRGLRMRDANNDVIPGIRLVASLFHSKKLKINKTKCPNIIKELSSYIWNDKLSEKGNEQPVKDSDHALDALRYICFTIIKRV